MWLPGAKSSRRKSHASARRGNQDLSKTNHQAIAKKAARVVYADNYSNCAVPHAVSLSPYGRRVYARLARKIRMELAGDPEMAVLQSRLEAALSIEVPKQPKQKISAEAVWRNDLRMNRTTSYYNCESVALRADLEYVVASENRRMLSEEIVKSAEKRKREIARRVCSAFWPLVNLPDPEWQGILLSLGATPPDPPNRLPTTAASRYRVIVRPAPPKDDWEPDPETLELITEDAARGREDPLQAMVAAGLVSPGKKVCLTYGSSGGRKGKGAKKT